MKNILKPYTKLEKKIEILMIPKLKNANFINLRALF